MPTDIELSNTVAYVLGGSGVVGLLGVVIKFLLQSVRQEKRAQMESNAEVGSYAMLTADVKRLVKRCEQLEAQVGALKVSQIEDVYDLAALTTFLLQMPCGNCEITPEMFDKAGETLTRMSARKRKMANNEIRLQE